MSRSVVEFQKRIAKRKKKTFGSDEKLGAGGLVRYVFHLERRFVQIIENPPYATTARRYDMSRRRRSRDNVIARRVVREDAVQRMRGGRADISAGE